MKGSTKMEKVMQKMELRADVSRLWELEVKATYSSHYTGDIAVREAFQNSVDAYRRHRISNGTFAVNTSEDDQKIELTMTDCAGGMSMDECQSKFLTLGCSDKTTGEDNGGFGVAKAIILGASQKWSIRSRDWSLDSQTMETTREEVVPGVTISKTIPTQSWGGSAAAIYLALSEPRIPVTLTGNVVTGYVQLPRARKLDMKLNWGGTNVAVIKKYKARELNIPSSDYKSLDLSYSGMIVVRLGGLVQFYTRKSSISNLLVIVDLTTREIPGTRDYPFTKGRDGLRGQADRAMDDLLEYLDKESSHAKMEDVWVTKEYSGRNVFEQKFNHECESVESISAFKTPSFNNFGKASFIIENRPSLPASTSTTVDLDESEVNPVDFSWTLLKATGYKCGNFKAENYIKEMELWAYMLTKCSAVIQDEHQMRPGLVLSPEVDGVNKANNGINAIMFNPIHLKKKENFVQSMYLVMLHELVHNHHNYHNDSFYERLDMYQEKCLGLLPDFYAKWLELSNVDLGICDAIFTMLGLEAPKNVNPKKLKSFLGMIKNFA